MQNQVAGIDVSTEMQGHSVYRATEWSANIELGKRTFGRVISGLRFRLLSVRPSDLRFGIAVFLLLLQECQVGLGFGKLILRVTDLTRRRGSGLL